ncbi:MAG TPA: glycosyltransferase family 9 protein [Planctomycetota bacterium]
MPARVLAVRLGAIGDVTNALVFAAALKEARPDVFVGWAVHPLAQPLVEGHPCVDRVHPWRRGGGLSEFARLVREIRGERYDVAVDLQRIQKSAWLARLAGAPRVLGYDRARTKELSWLLTRERLDARGATRHMVEHYLEFARHLGAPARAPRHLLPPDAEAEAWAAHLVDGLGGAPVLVNLGASKPANRWAPERFGALARALADDGRAVCFTGGPGDRAAAERARAAAGAGPRDLVGATSLRQLVALARRARLFVGCDTGPMHLAAAVGTPVVALFGPADPARTGPFGPAHLVLREHPPCAPCGRKTCNQPRHACMEDLTVERVLAAVRERLASGAMRERPAGKTGA